MLMGPSQAVKHEPLMAWKPSRLNPVASTSPLCVLPGPVLALLLQEPAPRRLGWAMQSGEGRMAGKGD
jgi:hypothetical protein